MAKDVIEELKKINEKIDKRKLLYVLYALFYAFYLYIAICVPYVFFDDWAWGTDTGISWYIHASQNSRFVGNALVLLLTRSVVMKNIIMSAVCFAIPVLMTRIVYYRQDRIDGGFVLIYVFSNFSLLTMPLGMWQQTYSWVSGFCNYVFGFFCVLIFIYMFLLFSDDIKIEMKKKSIVFLCVFGVFGQLMLENYAMAVAGAGFITLVMARENKKAALMLFVSNLAGFIIICSNKIYFSLLRDGTALDGVRTMRYKEDGGLVSSIGLCFKSRIPLLLAEYKWLILALYIGLFLLAIKNKVKKICIIFGVVDFALLIEIVRLIILDESFFNINNFDRILVLIIFFNIPAELFSIHKTNGSVRAKAGFIVFIVGFLQILPFAFVFEWGGRIHFGLFVCLCLLLSLVLAQILKTVAAKLIIFVISVYGIVAMANYTVVYKGIHEVTNERLSVMEEYTDGSMELPAYSEEQKKYIWGGRKLQGLFTEYLCKFYEVDIKAEDLIFEN